jgi:hypothetical protein
MMGQNESLTLAEDLLLDKKPSKYGKTLRRVVTGLAKRHDFAGMVRRLNPDESNVFEIFSTVVREMVDDLNWGRVVAVYAFALYLAKDISTNSCNVDVNISHLEEKFASFVGERVNAKFGPWIREQGGWHAFEVFFSEPSDFKRIVLAAILG